MSERFHFGCDDCKINNPNGYVIIHVRYGLVVRDTFRSNRRECWQSFLQGGRYTKSQTRKQGYDCIPVRLVGREQ